LFSVIFRWVALGRNSQLFQAHRKPARRLGTGASRVRLARH
jgi:hypothetical protein